MGKKGGRVKKMVMKNLSEACCANIVAKVKQIIIGLLCFRK